MILSLPCSVHIMMLHRSSPLLGGEVVMLALLQLPLVARPDLYGTLHPSAVRCRV